jgi:malate dehydrogenase
VTTGQGSYEVVPNLDINDFSRRQVDRSTAELVEERDSVASLGLLA